MPDLDFKVVAIEAVKHAAVPTLYFKLAIANQAMGKDARPPPIQSIALQCQIRIDTRRCTYKPQEKARLTELFGESEHWSRTLHSMLWTHASVVVPAFDGDCTQVDLPVPCSFDFNVAVNKFLHALEGGEVPLILLFSGSIFYLGENGALQVSQISWNKEAAFPLSVKLWQQMMDHYYPNGAWLCLRKDVFDRLSRFKTRAGLPTWEHAVERLLEMDTTKDHMDTLQCIGASSDALCATRDRASVIS